MRDPRKVVGFPFESLNWHELVVEPPLADRLRERGPREEWPRIAERDLRRFFEILRRDPHVWEEFCEMDQPRSCSCALLATTLPDHVCEDVARWSVFEYALTHPRADTPVDYPHIYPLPVDQTAVDLWRYCTTHKRPHPATDGLGQWLGLAVKRETERGTVWILGLVEPDGVLLKEALCTEDPIAWRFVAPAMQCERREPPQAYNDPLQRAEALLWRWYVTTLQGMPLNPVGRPRGWRAMSPGQFRGDYPRQYAAFVADNGRRPTEAEMAADLGLSKATFYRYLRENGLSFPPANY